MSKPGNFAVIGLGRFGRAAARSLIEEGQSVLVADLSQDRVAALADEADAAVAVDATDEEALSGLGLERMSCVLVSIGGAATEASILTTALLRKMGVPRIVARASNELHARVLVAVGAHEVVNPEDEIGHRLAQRLAHPGVVDQLDLGKAVVAEVEAPEAFAGRTLGELELRQSYDVTVLALRRGENVRANPQGSDGVESGDVLVLMGERAAIQRIAALA